MSAVALSVRTSTVDRLLAGALVLLACFGQPNAVYLVVPFFYPLLATYFLLLLVYLLASDDLRVGIYAVRMGIGIPLTIFFLLAGISVSYARVPSFTVTLLLSAALKVMMFYMLMIAARRANVNDVVARVIVAAAVFFSITSIALFLGVVLFDLSPIREFGSMGIGGGLEYEHQLRFYGLGFVRSETSLLDVVFPRLQSFFAEPGYFAFFLELSLFATLYHKHLDAQAPGRARHTKRVAALQVVALMLSLSLGAMVAIGVGMVVYLLASPTLRLTAATAFKAAAALVTGAVLWLFWNTAERPLSLLYTIVVGERFETAYGGNSADTRMAGFQLGVDLVEQRPVFGWGFGQVRIVLEGLGVNNSFLTVFAELGIVGLLAYLGILFTVVLTVRNSLALSESLGQDAVRATAAIAGMFAATTVHSLLLDTSWSFIYWLAISLVFLHHRYLLTITRGGQQA